MNQVDQSSIVYGEFLASTSPVVLPECSAFDSGEITLFNWSRHRTSFSSSSGSSVSEPVSPITRRSSSGSTDAICLDGDIDADVETSDAPWNLVAYNVPWGPGYEGYNTGTLPGPDGMCVFLRSPTPLKRQRTSQACDNCRERKAKCSGTRPSCARCISRELPCAYGPSGTPAGDAQPTQSRKSLQRRFSHSGSSCMSIKRKMSTRTRVRHKSSMPESDIRLGLRGTGGVTASDGCINLSHEYDRSVFRDTFITSPASRHIISGRLNAQSDGRHPHSILGDVAPPTNLEVSSVDSPQTDIPIHGYPALLDDRGYNTSTVQYSTLDEYRFPPRESFEGPIIPQIQPLRLTQVQQSIDGQSGSLYNFPVSVMQDPASYVAAASGQVDADWHGPQFESHAEFPALSYLEYNHFRSIQIHNQVSSGHSSLPSSSSSGGIFETGRQNNSFSNDVVPFGPLEPYKALLAYDEIPQCVPGGDNPSLAYFAL